MIFCRNFDEQRSTGKVRATRATRVGLGRFGIGRRLLGLGLVGLLGFAVGPAWADEPSEDPTGGTRSSDVDTARRSVVRIQTTFFNYSYESPWKQPQLAAAGGTGFIIEGNRILTNAHVVSRANTIRVQRGNQRADYEAKILHIAHDCDLALLTVDDPEFYKGAQPLEIGHTPPLNTSVIVIGFPIGGNRVSITRGVVSRLGTDRYSHSQVDWHRVIQVDAAINPGNSGGPALYGNKVIGVAFQVYRRGQNLGYLIPPEVIRKFLSDITDGTYDGYIDLGVLTMATTNAILRRALELPGSEAGESEPKNPDTGVLIYGIIPGASADGFLEAGDVLLKLNGHAIAHSGDVEIDGQMYGFGDVVDNLNAGEMITAEVSRGGQRRNFTFPARRARILDFQRRNYDTPPSYFMVGGLLFQPLDAELLSTYGNRWAQAGSSEILYRYFYFLVRGFYKNKQSGIVLTRRLADPVNVYADASIDGMVESVNGYQPRDLADFAARVDAVLQSERYLVIRFLGRASPLVLRSSDLREAGPRVLQTYELGRDRYWPELKK